MASLSEAIFYATEMALLQPLIDFAEICYTHGIRHVVISPGSRSAALTLAFSRHEGFEKHVVMDERSAAFIALGMAQQLDKPVVLICTSGSAAYNYAPAIAEAFFQHIPLLILTADRPQEWIHQLDGQTIYQSEIYGKHVKKSFTIPADYVHKDAIWQINRTANEAAALALAIPFGPVHVNVPIREPFYPVTGEVFKKSDGLRTIKMTNGKATLPGDTWTELLEEWQRSKRILIAGGQHKYDPKLHEILSKISQELDVVVVGDTIANQGADPDFITFQDLLLPKADKEELRPDLLITYGLSFVSKELKQFLQKNPAASHWHISEDPHLVDTFFSLSRVIPVTELYFFENIFEKIDYQLFVEGEEPDTDSAYKQKWISDDRKTHRITAEYLKNLTTLNDLTCVNLLLEALPEGAQLHVGNSMPVRYVNALGQKAGKLQIFANRGTSGIDGCLSTAIGAALVNNTQTFLLIGDVSFLYDRNGLLIQDLPENLKIIVLNNNGGNIFSMIDGPAGLPELNKYFETRHSFNAKRTAEDSNIDYFSVRSLESFDATIHLFLESQRISLLELFTDPSDNVAAWKGLKTFIGSYW